MTDHSTTTDPAQTHSHEDHTHDHDHDHDEHDHKAETHAHHDDHDHDHDHDHEHSSGALGWLKDAIPFFHGHSHAEANVDRAMESSDRGIWALKVSLAGLGITALFQIIIVFISGSVALLADTIHNFSDAFTAVPLWVAFVLGRRAASRRYTYGYGRAEDIAGVIIVIMIFASAVVSAYESYTRLVNPQPLLNVGWVIAAAIIGFIGNEAVATFRIRVGNEIGSAALIADGKHARADGFTSLAVLVGALGALAGFPLADPIVGLLITVAILFIVKDTAVTMWQRLMDAVDPELVDKIEQTTADIPGVQGVHDVRVRWVGHKLHADLHILVDEDLSTFESHEIGEEVRHALLHALPKLSVVSIHTDPCGHSGRDAHALSEHHNMPIASKQAVSS